MRLKLVIPAAWLMITAGMWIELGIGLALLLGGALAIIFMCFWGMLP